MNFFLLNLTPGFKGKSLMVLSGLGTSEEFHYLSFSTFQVNPLNANPLNGLEAVTDTFSGFAKTVNVVRTVMRNKNDEKSDSQPSP